MNKLRIAFLFLLSLLLVPHSLLALVLEPWYSRIYELEPELQICPQYSKGIASSRHVSSRALPVIFHNQSIGMAYYDWYGQVELGLADSSFRRFGMDHATLNVRYQFLNDVPGISPVSLVVSTSVSSVPRSALNDPTAFHHGRLEGIAEIAVGKEIDAQQFWLSRYWGVFGVGIADVGSPWMHLKLCVEKNCFDRHRWSIFLDGLFGLGGKALSLHHFHGYGPIAHRSVDCWIAYRRDFECGLKATAGVAYRLYAYNFPKNTISGLFSILYPFGL